MPKYLAIDFLGRALKQKEQFLSQVLLSCPDLPEADLPTCDNEKSIFWLDNKHYIQAYHLPFGDIGADLISSNLGKHHEKFASDQDDDQYQQHDFDTGSPVISITDSLSELEEEIVQDICESLDEINYSATCDWKEANDMMVPWHQLWEIGRLQLEETITINYFDEFLRRIPQHYNLMAKLKPGRIPDPFLDKNNQPRNERKLICLGLTYEERSERTNLKPLLNEQFSKQLIIYDQSDDDGYLAFPVVEDTFKPETTLPDQLCQVEYETYEQTMETNVDDLQSTFKNSNMFHEDYGEAAIPPLDISFIKLNDIEEEKSSRDLASLVFESSLFYSPSDVSQSHKQTMDNVLSKVDDCYSHDLDMDKVWSTCSPCFKSKVEKKILFSSTLFDTFASLLLEVPDVKDENNDEIQRILTSLHVPMKEDFTDGCELELHWGSLSKLQTSDVCKLQAPYFDNVVLYNFDIPPSNIMVERISWSTIYEKTDNEAILHSGITREQRMTPSCHFSNKPHKKTQIAKKTSCAINVKNDYGSLPGLDDFVLLRTGAKPLNTKHRPPQAIVKAMPIEDTFDRTSTNTVENKEITRKKFENDHIVMVPLCRDYQSVFNKIMNNVKEHFVRLQEIENISQSYLIENLTTDYTRFMLKQEEKRSGIRESIRNSDNKKYRLLIILHALVCAAELLKECDLTFAKEHLGTMSIRYKNYLNAALDPFIDILMGAEQRLETLNITHPKIVKTRDIIHEWTLKSSYSLQEKILVIITRGFKQVSASLLRQLNNIQGLRTLILDSNTHDFSVIYEVNVVITEMVSHDLPWSNFPSVIVYEDKNSWFEKVLKERGIKHFVCLKTVVNVNKESKMMDNEKEECDILKSTMETYRLIGSTKITRDADLLVCLEQNCHIVVIEREYKQKAKNKTTAFNKMCLQPDVMIDEKTGVIIEDISNFSTGEGYKNAIDLVLSASFKCQMCSVIIKCVNDSRSTFCSDVQANLAKFHGCLLSIQLSFPEFVVDVSYSYSAQQTAKLIRRLCDLSRKSSNESSYSKWLERDWLTDEITQHESFLLSFPSLNSFSAQVMLQIMPLKELLALPYQRLKTELPWLPDRILIAFKKMVDCGVVQEEEEEEEEREEREFTMTTTPYFPEEDQNCFSNSDRTGIPQDFLSNLKNNQVVGSYERTFPLMRKSTDSPPFAGFQCSTDEMLPTEFREHRIQGSQTNRNPFHQIISQLDHPSSKPHIEKLNKQRKQFYPTVRHPVAERSDSRDFVGIVQPKPRKNELFENFNIPKHKLPSLTKPRNTRKGLLQGTQEVNFTSGALNSENPGFLEKPKKKRRLACEIVPGSKDGQTRLTFV